MHLAFRKQMVQKPGKVVPFLVPLFFVALILVTIGTAVLSLLVMAKTAKVVM